MITRRRALGALALSAAPAASCATAARPTPTEPVRETTMKQPAAAPVRTTTPPCATVELRQYTLHPGKRDALIELFDREFIEGQEDAGMTILGQFRDLDDPDRFVWVRGFADLPTRGRSLAAFYGGPVWKANRETANATMIDSSDVLMLRPARPTSGLTLLEGGRPPRGTTQLPEGRVTATLCSFNAPVTDDFLSFFESKIVPALTEAGAIVRAYFVTDYSENNFPALPVREGEHVFVWFSGFDDAAAHGRHLAALARSSSYRGLSEELSRRLKGPPLTLTLAPTARSWLRGQS